MKINWVGRSLKTLIDVYNVMYSPLERLDFSALTTTDGLERFATRLVRMPTTVWEYDQAYLGLKRAEEEKNYLKSEFLLLGTIIQRRLEAARVEFVPEHPNIIKMHRLRSKLEEQLQQFHHWKQKLGLTDDVTTGAPAMDLNEEIYDSDMDELEE